MKRRGFGVLWVTLAVCVVLLFAVHSLTKDYQRAEQQQFSNSLLNHAELVSSQVMNAMRNAQDESISKCTAESLDQLRRIANQYLYVYDLGVVEADQVLCTANWGVFTTPSMLPDTYYGASSRFQLYSRAEGIFPVPLRLDITRGGSILAFTAEFSFQHFINQNRGFSYSLGMADQAHDFLNYQSRRQTIGWPERFNLSMFQLTTQSCSEIFRYCVQTKNNRAGILYFSAYFIAVIVVISLIFGFLVAYTIQSYLYKKNSMEFRLRRAIQTRLIYVEYQPILHAGTGKIVGVESLVRWNDAIYGKVSPEHFISIAENMGLYEELTFHVAGTSIEEMAPVLKRDSNFTLSINVSSFEVLCDEYLLFLKNKVKACGVPHNQLKIEITEKISVPLEALSAFSHKAKQCGFRVSLDDFGTGVANLVWLTEMAFDDIKIDRTFTQSLNDAFKDKMVLSIMAMVSDLHKQVIFEGVETQGELDVIVDRFSDAYVQGWYYYRSLSKEALFEVLQSHGDTMSAA
ncbi:hypothetical protein CWE09_10760 [Aliidiomarina minuta]|uniref:cyclic-guanylate-specific phosphodiesterase n=1 Tax=Aliidiomarina minuta TaxID=880057 RepID=A0A432W4D2_9GAMM|nr:EAL domain-containing protein [Aliidiomarina minuta]RUO24348.1 hypothetical protein CWE09_10760 [Aliidiomarina minuta]